MKDRRICQGHSVSGFLTCMCDGTDSLFFSHSSLSDFIRSDNI